MKRVLLSLILGLMAGVLQAQNATKVQEPEYINVFFVLNPADGSLVPLERQTAIGRFKSKALGLGGGAISIEINGEKSPIRFKADQQPSFVVRLASQQTDPAGAVQFFLWQSKKGVRSHPITEVASMGLSAKDASAGASVSFDAARYGESSIRLAPTKPLAPGEYALGPTMAHDALGAPQNYNAFSFGIDPPEEKPESKQK